METTGNFRYERYNFRIISALMALLAVVFFVNGSPLGGIISLAIGVLLSFSYQGVELDQDKKLYRKYDRFHRFYIGKWEPLSTPSYVSIVRINLSSRRSAPAPMVMPESGKDAKSFKVNLVVEGDERFISICRGSLEDMTREALRLGKHLGIRVLDYSTHEKHWIL